MALKKDIELDNGVVVNYHRISMLTTYVNNTIIITIVSYVNEEKRDEELNANKNTDEELTEYSDNNSLKEVYNIVATMTEEKEYEEDFDVKAAYEYLKTLDKFKDAEDA